MSEFYRIIAVGPLDAFEKMPIKNTVFAMTVESEVNLDLHEAGWLAFSNVTVVEAGPGNFLDLGLVVSFHQIKVQPVKYPTHVEYLELILRAIEGDLPLNDSVGKQTGIAEATLLKQFHDEGIQASMHYVDDSGKEWGAGDACKARAMGLVEAHPELFEHFRVISKGFLWNFSW